jgi:hypothetical protein
VRPFQKTSAVTSPLAIQTWSSTTQCPPAQQHTSSSTGSQRPGLRVAPCRTHTAAARSSTGIPWVSAPRTAVQPAARQVAPVWGCGHSISAWQGCSRGLAAARPGGQATVPVGQATWEIGHLLRKQTAFLPVLPQPEQQHPVQRVLRRGLEAAHMPLMHRQHPTAAAACGSLIPPAKVVGCLCCRRRQAWVMLPQNPHLLRQPGRS